MALTGQSSTFTPPGSPIPGQFAADARLRKQRAADRAIGIYPVPHVRIEQPRVYQDEDGKARQLKYGHPQPLRGGSEGPGGYVPHPTPVYGKQGVAPPMPMGMVPIGSRPNGASGPMTPSGQVNPFQPAAKPTPSALSSVGGTPAAPVPRLPATASQYEANPGAVQLPVGNPVSAPAHFSVKPEAVTPLNRGPASALTPNNTQPLTVQPNWIFPPGRVPQQPASALTPANVLPKPTNAHPGLSPLQKFNLIPKFLIPPLQTEDAIPPLQTEDAVQRSMQAPPPLDSPPSPYDASQPRLAMPTPQRKLLPPPTPQDVAAISRTQAERRGANELREKIAFIGAYPTPAEDREGMFPRNDYGTSEDPVQRAKDFRLNESMANQHEHNVAGQKIIDRNQRVHDSRGQSPEMQARMDSGYNQAMRIGQPPQAGVPSQPQSIFPRQAPPNNRMQGTVPTETPRDMSGANGVAISQVDGSKSPQVGYIPANRSDGTVGTSRFVEGQTTPLGTRVVRNPKTGGLALIGKGISGPSSGAADDPFAGNVPTKPTAAQFQDMQQQGEVNDTEFTKQRVEAEKAANGGYTKAQIAKNQQVLSAARSRNLGMDVPRIKQAATEEKERLQALMDTKAGMTAATPVAGGVGAAAVERAKIDSAPDGQKYNAWARDTRTYNPLGENSTNNSLENLYANLEKNWGSMPPAEQQRFRVWYNGHEQFGDPNNSLYKTPSAKKIREKIGGSQTAAARRVPSASAVTPMATPARSDEEYTNEYIDTYGRPPSQGQLGKFKSGEQRKAAQEAEQRNADEQVRQRKAKAYQEQYGSAPRGAY